jgi:hypothetical protein
MKQLFAMLIVIIIIFFVGCGKTPVNAVYKQDTIVKDSVNVK